jgi:DNA-binding NarL/FixJ family response regulator
MAIRVLIVDDHDVVRRGLIVFLRAFDDFILAGQARNGYEAVQLCATLDPQVVLMDVMMPEMDGITATRLIKETYPHIPVIVLTNFGDSRNIQTALAAGAARCVGKDASIDELAGAIHEVCSTSAG